MGVKDIFGGISKNKEPREREQTGGDGSASGAAKSKSRGDMRALAECVKNHPSNPSLYEEFERAFLASVEVQTYLDDFLYDVYKKQFIDLCRPLLKFVGFSHYGGSLDDKVWQDGLDEAAEDLKGPLAQDLPQTSDLREKQKQELKLDLSYKCTRLLLNIIACSHSALDNWDEEKRERLKELRNPNGGHHFKAWRKHLELTDRRYPVEKMKEAYWWLIDVADHLGSGRISPGQDKYTDYGKNLEEYLTRKVKEIDMKLVFFEDEAIQKSTMRLHFRDSKLKCPGLFKGNGEYLIEGEYPKQQ